MAKINVTGNAVVITSTIQKEDILKVKKYRPDALTLFEEKDGKKVPVFAINVGKAAFNEYGITFDGKTHDEAGYATFTTLIPECAGNVEEAIADLFGGVILKLNKFEAQFPAVLGEIAEERKAILETIEIA